MRKYGCNDPLTTAQTASLATASTDVIRSIVGRTRWLYELVSGESGDADEVAVTPKNPAGTIGVNLTGPPWGPALRHTVWCTGGIVDTTTTAVTPPPIVTLKTDVDYQVNVFELKVNMYLRRFANWQVAGDKAAPYSRLRLSVRASASTSTTLRVSVGQPGSYTQIAALSVTSTEAYFFGDTLIPAQPGKNSFYLKFTRDNQASVVNVTHLGLHNIEKLEHAL